MGGERGMGGDERDSTRITQIGRLYTDFFNNGIRINTAHSMPSLPQRDSFGANPSVYILQTIISVNRGMTCPDFLSGSNPPINLVIVNPPKTLMEYESMFRADEAIPITKPLNAPLAIEFRLQGIAFIREKDMPIFYKEELLGKRRVDFLVEGIVSVEIKANTALTDTNLAQAINYLEAYDLEIGLLINFGAKSLEFKRIINKKFNQKRQRPNI
jgi:GxxExxY protein